jgi:hypothetical protein
MISIIFSILSPLLILIGFVQVKRNGGFSVFVKRLRLKQQGVICYDCSCERELPPSVSLYDNENKLWQCKSCSRQSKILEINNKIKLYFRKLSEFLISKNFQKFGNLFIILAFLCVLIQIIFYFINIKVNLSVLSNIILSIYWLLLILRQWIVFK